MPWKIKVYTLVEAGDSIEYATKKEADDEILQLSMMQPENVYEAVEV